jgi:hypothetical protein
MTSTCRSKPRKAMRVATIFTGTAAAVAFAPAAMATTVLHGAAGHESPKLHTGGHITSKPCSSPGTSHWLHLAFTSSGNQFGTSRAVECYGFTGTAYHPSAGVDNVAASICGGNNSGWYTSINGAKATFKEGNGWVHTPWYGTSHAVLGEVHINGWSHSDACRTSPA